MNVVTNIKNVGIEVKTSIVFALFAFVVSMLMGLINGIAIGTVLLRTLLLTSVFAGLGFGIIFVFQRYVPEFYNLLNEVLAKPHTGETMSHEAGAEPERIVTAAKSAATKQEVTSESKGKMEETSDQDFTELTEEDFSKIVAATDDGGIASKKKLGKHIIATEKIVSYEPKIMAQAVQTMMRRDED